MDYPRIAIIGAGSVGSTTAYALMLQNIRAHIFLIDTDQIRCTGEISDLSDARNFCSGSTITVGSMQEAQKSDIIIIAAGQHQEPNQDRQSLFAENKKIIRSIIEQLLPLKKSAIIIMVTNPVDPLAYYAQKVAKIPHHQLFGSGTFLDSTRLRFLLSQKLNIAQESIHAYILGEHGDSQFPSWKTAFIGGIPLTEFTQISQSDMDSIARTIREKAYQIISCKGATFFGIATCVSALCKSILLDEKRIMPLSVYNPDLDIYISLPVVLGKNGIEKLIIPNLSTEESALFLASAERIKAYIDTTR